MSKPLLVLAAAAALAGCAGQIDHPIVQPQLHVVDATGFDVRPDSLRVPASAAAALGVVAAGDVLVSSTGAGFLRRVVSVSRDGDGLTLATAPAALDDALVEGVLHSSDDLLAPGQRAADRVVDVPPLVVTFDELPLVGDGSAPRIALNGSVTLHPYLDVDLSVSGGRVQLFDLVLHGDVDASAELDLTAGNDGDMDPLFDKTLWTSAPMVLTQWIGPVPVVEAVTLSLHATGDAHASATLTLGGVDAHAAISAGARYDGSGWSAVGDHTLTLAARPASADVALSADGTINLLLQADIKFYDLAGPYVTVGPYASVTLADDGSGTVTRTGRIGFSGDFGGDLSVMGHHVASYDAQLFDVGRDADF